MLISLLLAFCHRRIRMELYTFEKTEYGRSILSEVKCLTEIAVDMRNAAASSVAINVNISQ